MNNLEELSERIREFNSARDWEKFHSPKNLSTSLVVEAAELSEIFQWLTEDESRSLNDDRLARVKEEVGDVLIYLLIICDKLGIDPLDAADHKIDINGMKYPVEKARGNPDKLKEFM